MYRYMITKFTGTNMPAGSYYRCPVRGRQCDRATFKRTGHDRNVKMCSACTPEAASSQLFDELRRKVPRLVIPTSSSSTINTTLAAPLGHALLCFCQLLHFAPAFNWALRCQLPEKFCETCRTRLMPSCKLVMLTAST